MSRFKKVFNSVSRIKSVQFCGSYSQKKFNSVGQIHKSSILWVFLMKKLWVLKKKIHFFESKVFKKVQVFESRQKEGSIIWVMWKRSKYWSHEKRNNSFSQIEQKKVIWVIFSTKKSSIFWVISKKGSILSILSEFFVKKKSILKVISKKSILWVNWKIRLNHVNQMKKVQFFESCSKRVQIFDSFLQKSQICKSYKKVGSTLQIIWEKFHPLSHIEKVLLKKCSILRVICWKGFSSLSNIEKGSILWVKLKRRVFHSVSHSFSKKV